MADQSITSTVISAAVGSTFAIFSSYFITSDKIEQEFESWNQRRTLEFESWEKRLKIEKAFEELEKRRSEIVAAEIEFSLHRNRVRQLKPIVYIFSYNTWLYENRPDFLIGMHSSEEAEEIMASVAENIAQAQSQQLAIYEMIAGSDANVNAKFGILKRNHGSHCAEAIASITSALQSEIDLIDSFPHTLKIYLLDRTGWTTRDEFIEEIRSSDAFISLMDTKGTDGIFENGIKACHSEIEKSKA